MYPYGCACKHTFSMCCVYGRIYMYNMVVCGDAHSVIVIVVGNGHSDTSSNPGHD